MIKGCYVYMFRLVTFAQEVSLRSSFGGTNITFPVRVLGANDPISVSNTLCPDDLMQVEEKQEEKEDDPSNVHDKMTPTGMPGDASKPDKPEDKEKDWVFNPDDYDKLDKEEKPEGEIHDSLLDQLIPKPADQRPNDAKDAPDPKSTTPTGEPGMKETSTPQDGNQ